MKWGAILSLVGLMGVTSYVYVKNDKREQHEKLVSRYPESKTHNIRIMLTDAPNDKIKEVYVNIDHVEILFSGSSGTNRITTAANYGSVDLLKLRNGIMIPIDDVSAPIGSRMNQIRFVLKDTGHYITKSDGSRCELQTPSQQQSGLKILVKQDLTVEKNMAYSLVMDFDAMKSVVIQGNGECLLKPVIKLKSATRIALNEEEDQETVADVPQNEVSEEVIVDNSGDTGEEQQDSTDSGGVVAGGGTNNDTATDSGNDSGSTSDSSNDSGNNSTADTGTNSNDQTTGDTTVVTDNGTEESKSEDVTESSPGDSGTADTGNGGSSGTVDPYAGIDPDDPSTWPNDYSPEEFAAAYPQLVNQ